MSPAVFMTRRHFSASALAELRPHDTRQEVSGCRGTWCDDADRFSRVVLRAHVHCNAERHDCREEGGSCYHRLKPGVSISQTAYSAYCQLIVRALEGGRNGCVLVRSWARRREAAIQLAWQPLFPHQRRHGRRIAELPAGTTRKSRSVRDLPWAGLAPASYFSVVVSRPIAAMTRLLRKLAGWLPPGTSHSSALGSPSACKSKALRISSTRQPSKSA